MNDTSEREPAISAGSIAQLRGCHEIAFPASSPDGPDLPLLASYTLPSGAIKSTRGFATADGQMKSRCYVDEEGLWSWEAKNLEGRCLQTGTFSVVNSPLPGKLRISRSDPRQLQTDIGRWYLNFGDNAYRFLALDESRWRAYVDQSAQAGFNRIRSWLSPSVDALLDTERKKLDLDAWERIDERLCYALQRHPEMQFELVLLGPNADDIKRFGEGELGAHSVFRYAIERFSPLPNVHWSLADNADDTDTEIAQAITMAGDALFESDPWNSLSTQTGSYFQSPRNADKKWVSIQSIRTLGEVVGKETLSARAAQVKPVAVSQDRGEHEYAPKFPRYYFRRLFWGTLLSGGLPTYTGLKTSKPHDRNDCGIEGYYDACNSSRLRSGAHDLLQIKRFFAETQVSLENWTPDDSLSGNNPLLVKTAISEEGDACIAYVANPESYAAHSPEGFDGVHSDAFSNTSETFTTFTLELPFSSGRVKWYSPTTGEWKGEAEITKNSTTLLTPEPGDWVAWVTRA